MPVIWNRTLLFRFTLLLALLGGPYAAMALSGKVIELSAEPLPLRKPADFTVMRVEDLREDTGSIGVVMTGMVNRRRPLEFPSRADRYLSHWFGTVLPPNEGARPIILQLMTLFCSEEINGTVEYAICRMEVRVLTPEGGSHMVHGEFRSAAIEQSSIDVTRLHARNIRLCLTDVLDQFDGRGWALGVPLPKTFADGQFRPDFPWPRYRSFDPDSLPNGVYANIMAFRDGSPMPGQFTAIQEGSESAPRISLRHESGPLSGRAVKTGKFCVHKRVAYVRSGEYFLPMNRDRNGFYLLVPRPEISSFVPIMMGAGFGMVGGLVGAMIVEMNRSNHSPENMSRHYLDMRTGKVVSEFMWREHLAAMNPGNPVKLVVYSRDRYLADRPITIATQGDTLTHLLRKGTKAAYVLKNPFSIYTLYGKGVARLELMAKPGTTYIKATMKEDDPVLEAVSPDVAEYDLRGLEGKVE